MKTSNNNDEPEDSAKIPDKSVEKVKPVSGNAKPTKPRKRAKKVDDVSQDQEFINQLLQSAVNKYADEIRREEKEWRDDLECLLPIVSEFLEDFIIIGHTVDGARAVVKYSPTPRLHDSLQHLIREYLMQDLASGGMMEF